MPVAILLSLAASVAVLALSYPFVLLTGIALPLPEPLDARTFTSIALATDAAVLLVTLLVLRWSASPVRLVFPERWLRPTMAAFLGVALVNGLGTALIRWAGEAYTGFPELRPDAWGIAATFVGVVVAPFSEELFFREAILARIFGNVPRSLAVVLSSILFGAFHLGSGGGILVVTLCLMGAIFADLRLRTGSLGPPLLLHALNNGIALLLAFRAGS